MNDGANEIISEWKEYERLDDVFDDINSRVFDKVKVAKELIRRFPRTRIADD